MVKISAVFSNQLIVTKITYLEGLPIKDKINHILIKRNLKTYFRRIVKITEKLIDHI